MDQENPQQNIPYESISSSMPTFESFTSQQNVILEDETIDVENIGVENKKTQEFNMPSRFKIARDISKFYLEERNRLFKFLSKDSTTVHLTTDTWTSSCKRMNFMVLTAHFIDEDWVMHKRRIWHKVEKVEKDMGSLFAIYKEKYGTTTSTELPRSTSSKSTSSRSRRGNAFLNSFKDKVGNKLSGW
ncbi:hypothetical protein Tco_1310079 [Tanacetum coccineum]